MPCVSVLCFIPFAVSLVIADRGDVRMSTHWNGGGGAIAAGAMHPYARKACWVGKYVRTRGRFESWAWRSNRWGQRARQTVGWLVPLTPERHQ